MTTIALAMIVKNEATVIRRCLATVRPWITHWAIVDTGSTDGTQDIVRAEMADLPGQLIERKWVDFATNRNQSLELARSLGADYTLIIDADEEFVPVDESVTLDGLGADSYAARFHLTGSDDAVWVRRVLIKSSLPWRYEGEIHEHLECDGAGQSQPMPFEIFSHSDGARNQDRIAKYRADAKVLRRMVKRAPTDGRSWYYLAQSLSGCGEVDKAIDAYEKRASLPGWNEEIFSSLYQIAALKDYRGDHWEDVARAYLRAYECRPTRAEPLWALAVLHNDRDMPAAAELYARRAASIPRPPDALVVHESVYKFRAADELAGALCRLGRHEDALRVLERLLSLEQLPDSERPRIAANIDWLREQLAERAAA
jgi:glycosyltransferase involved in cell wall biosynthesis